MRVLLAAMFIGNLVAMTVVTVRASIARPVWDNGKLLEDPWFVATLCDACCGFLTFFVWVAFRERTWPARAGWLIAIMLLGNFAMATYVLIHLMRLPAGRPTSDLLRPLETR